MDIQNFLSDHMQFTISLAYYFVPAMVGAALTTYVKHIGKEEPETDKKKSFHVGWIMFFSALVPSWILASIHDYLSGIIPLTSIRIGIAFVFGCVGDETLEVITSLKNLLAILKVLSTYIEGLKHVTHVSEEVVNEIDKVKTKPEVIEVPKPNPPPESPQNNQPSNPTTHTYHNQYNDDSDDDYYVE